jgi:molybdopterin-biosynthesis enzyme MoeA-like protein
MDRNTAHLSFGIIIIGDELLTGKRQDKHFQHVISLLKHRGLELQWCQIIGDDPDLITETLRYAMAKPEAVFCFGGIGATPDDHTRQCAARAANVALIRHPKAKAVIEAAFGKNAYPTRILMADLPAGSRIIPNPYNRIPGFRLGNLFFLPGFPQMAWPMMEWVLDRYYSRYFNLEPLLEHVITVFDAHESALVPIMQDLVRHFSKVRFSSLPSLGGERPTIELALRGRPKDVELATDFLRRALTDGDYYWAE